MKSNVRPGAYYDSVVLMQLQRQLAELPGILDAGVVMATAANKELLAQSDLLSPEAAEATADDLVLVVRSEDDAAARAALDQVDDLLARRRAPGASTYRPRSLDRATQMAPDARWVLVSIPGRFAADVAQQALDRERHVFLYSDNVPLEKEAELKTTAAARGLLVMGPDCGTALVNGVGLGFANRVRRGAIGIVAASGTGLQAVSVGIHRLGGGISHALGTGGRDLSRAVGAICARQGLDLLARDPQTEVIVLISKPPAPAVAAPLLNAARATGKPVVVAFIGYGEGRSREHGDGETVRFARSLDEAAALATSQLAAGRDPVGREREPDPPGQPPPFAPSQRFLRGLFSGGTLAHEALWLLQTVLAPVYSNAPLPGGPRLTDPHRSRGHTIVDMGDDIYTQGRLHPMMDNDLRIRRLEQEARDPETAVILLDLVLGDGAHPDPAGQVAPAITQALATAQEAGRSLAIGAVVVGSEDDPQDRQGQIGQMERAGATVFVRSDAAVSWVGRLLAANTENGSVSEPDAVRPPADGSEPLAFAPLPPVALSALTAPLAAINVGLETFARSLDERGVPVLHVDWRPPAGGDERLMGILARMKAKSGEGDPGEKG